MPEPIQALPRTRFDSILSSALLIFGGLIIVNTIIYYAYGATRLTALIILLPALLILIGKNFQKIRRSNYRLLIADYQLLISRITNYVSHNKRGLIFIFVFLLIETILFAALTLNRTTALMPSPWQAVGPWFFILYALATALLFFIITHRPHAETIAHYPLLITLTLTSLHLLLTFSVTAILYPLGWGFDAFVHRATEVWIQNHGSILPKQPYYIGQYSFVVWLSHLTGIAIFYLDVYLVPVLAALLLPPTVIFALQRVWGIEPRHGALLVWLIPFVPFFSLHLTTPHNLVLLLSILLVFTVLAYLKNQLHWSIPLLLAAAAVVTHPLLGAPMFLFAVFAFMLKKIQRLRIQLALISILILILTLLPAALFTINNLRSGSGWPTFTNPFTHLSEFFSLLARPYWYLDKAPFVYELLYGWQLLIVPTVILLAIGGFFTAYKKTRASIKPPSLDKGGLRGVESEWLLLASAFSFVLSAWLLKSWIVFPDVVAYEQGDFPLRILKASLIFALPFAMYGMYKIIVLAKKRKITWVMCHVSCVMLLMLSLYLSYPQRNIKARFPGYNVTASDFKAVAWIHGREKSEIDYIVLANQLVSAAALTNYSFAKYFDTPEGQIFYYSVPTGGPQYQEYGRMLYEGQKREYMEAAMDRVGVDTGYFVLNTYWANSDKIIEGAKESADSWYVVDDGRVWIFIYSNENNYDEF